MIVISAARCNDIYIERGSAKEKFRKCHAAEDAVLVEADIEAAFVEVAEMTCTEAESLAYAVHVHIIGRVKINIVPVLGELSVIRDRAFLHKVLRLILYIGNEL